MVCKKGLDGISAVMEWFAAIQEKLDHLGKKVKVLERKKSKKCPHSKAFSKKDQKQILKMLKRKKGNERKKQKRKKIAEDLSHS